MAMMTEIRTLQDFQAAYPVGQNERTGKWGWRRVNGCLNLNSCVFRTETGASQDRDEFFPLYLAGESKYLPR
jgi:hypothetical protein